MYVYDAQYIYKIYRCIDVYLYMQMRLLLLGVIYLFMYRYLYIYRSNLDTYVYTICFTVQDIQILYYQVNKVYTSHTCIVYIYKTYRCIDVYLYMQMRLLLLGVTYVFMYYYLYIYRSNLYTYVYTICFTVCDIQILYYQINKVYTSHTCIVYIYIRLIDVQIHIYMQMRLLLLGLYIYRSNLDTYVYTICFTVQDIQILYYQVNKVYTSHTCIVYIYI